jgi:hypothetical protein
MAALSLFALATSAGCGQKGADTVKVSGKVTIDGEPIPMGTISFFAADGKAPTAGGAIKDGTYTAEVPPGEKNVVVLGNKQVGEEKVFPDKADSPTRPKLETLTPLAYNAANTTPLKASVTAAKSDLDFQLTKQAKK